MKSDQSWRSSAESYKALIESGSLNNKLTEVVRQLYGLASWRSRNEVAEGIDQSPNDVSTRLRELAGRGVVRVHRERSECPITGRRVNQYALTSARRAGPRKSKAKKDLVTTQIVVGGCTKLSGDADCPFFCPDEDSGEPGCWAADFLGKEIVFADDFDHGQRPEGCPLKKRKFIISDCSNPR